MRDYPQAIAETNRIEPAPAARPQECSAGEVVFDTSERSTCGNGRTTRSTTSRSPTSTPSVLVDEEHPQRLQPRHGAAARPARR